MLISGLQSKFVEKSRGVFVKGVRESSFNHLEVFIFAFLKGLITWSHLLHYIIFFLSIKRAEVESELAKHLEPFV